MLSFKITKFLTAIFTPDLGSIKSATFLNTALELLGDRFDGEPTILPLPQDAPADIPRIILSSADKKWTLQTSLLRTSLFYEPTIDDPVTEDAGSFGLFASNFFTAYQQKLDLRTQRLAFITDRRSQKDTPASYLVEKFCIEELREKGHPFYNTRAFGVDSLKRYPWEGFTVNSWVKFRSAHAGNRPEDKFRVIVIQNDLNTLPYDEEPDQEFSPHDIERFFNKAPEELNKILDVYKVPREDTST